MTFVPEEISTFYFEEATFSSDTGSSDSGEVCLQYSFDKKYFLEEIFRFKNLPALETEERKNAFLKALQYLHIMAGVSYYKAALPKNIEMPYSLSKDTAEFFQELYTKGLIIDKYVPAKDGTLSGQDTFLLGILLGLSHLLLFRYIWFKSNRQLQKALKIDPRGWVPPRDPRNPDQKRLANLGMLMIALPIIYYLFDHYFQK